MKLLGLFPKYKVNRPLSENEYYGKLDQTKWQYDKFTDLIFNGFNSVIRLNSTYLEITDRHYIWKGFGMSFMLFFFSFAFALLFMSSLIPFRTSEFENLFYCFIGVLISLSVLFFIIVILFKEFFCWTHYPVRFNRKTRQIYVFGYDGKIRQAHWNDIVFTVRTDIKDFVKDNYIFVHLLSEDKSKVIYTFTLPIASSGRGSTEPLTQYWNFLCNYMTGDIEDNLAVMRVCPPIENHKEGFCYGMFQSAKVFGAYWPVLLFTFPLALTMGLTRYLVMLTCKIPKWSDEVEAACVIAPDDPINLSAATNPESLLSTFRIDSKAEREANVARRNALQAKMHAIVRLRKSRRQINTSLPLDDLIER